MADRTKIEWATTTWSPITGCTPVSEGCEHCYARRMAQRLKGRYGYPEDDPFRVTFHPDRLDQPLKWKKPRMVFVVSMGDLFHDDVPWEYIAAIHGVIAFNQQHNFLILTKRHERMAEFYFRFHNGNYVSNLNWWMNEACYRLPSDVTYGIRLRLKPESLPLPNLWLGVTAENQQRADERIPILLQMPAAVRFVSIEPMLGPVDLTFINPFDDFHTDALDTPDPSYKLHWVILGGETGPGARPMHPDWARSVQNQCQAAGVPFFFKKHGDYNRKAQGLQFITDPDNAGRLLDGRLWEEYPK